MSTDFQNPRASARGAVNDKPTPTELKAMWQLHAADIGGIFHYARAVLAKWGQPPAGAGEVAEHYRNAIASACEGWTMPDGLRKHLEDALWNPPTPQPTQTQPVAREPLPKFLALKFHARRDKKATVTLLFTGHEAADAWVRGIKGGQHVS